MTPLTLVLPVGDTKLINANSRMHFRPKALLTAGWRLAAAEAAQVAGLPKGLSHVHVVCVVTWPDRRRHDVSNLQPTLKAVMDGLVDYGLIPDDNDTFLTGPDMRAIRVPTKGGKPVLALTITPIPSGSVVAFTTRLAA